MLKWRKWKKTLKKYKMKRYLSTLVQVLAQHICMSAKKHEELLIRFVSIPMRKHSCYWNYALLSIFFIFKVVYAAAANASHNKGFNEADSTICKVEVNGGREKVKTQG